MFDDLIELVNKPLGSSYRPMTDERFHSSNIDDVIEYANAIGSEWNGDEAGRQEDRATVAADIVVTCLKLKELLAEMREL